ncbi:MAG: MOSC domain-containing protein [Alphaproteobacteria bacterium]
MAIIMLSGICGAVDATLIVRARERSLVSQRVQALTLGFDGIEGDSHAGLTRGSCGRVRRQYERGTQIRNTRQVSIICPGEMAQIAKKMGVGQLLPEWLGANLVIAGIPDLSHLPPSTRLIFSSGAALVVDVENGPCRYPGEVIEEHHPGHGNRFPKSALGLRGIVAWVERPGSIALNDTVDVHIPRTQVYEIGDAQKTG